MRQQSQVKQDPCLPLGDRLGFGRFPAEVCLIETEEGLFAANNATLPDGELLDGLACFSEPDEAAKYMELPDNRGLAGQVIMRTFDEARNIAKSKLRLNALLFFVNGRIVEYHFIR